MEDDEISLIIIITVGIIWFIGMLWADHYWFISDAKEACNNTYGVGLNDTYFRLIECENGVIGKLDSLCVIRNKWGNCQKSINVVEETK